LYDRLPEMRFISTSLMVATLALSASAQVFTFSRDQLVRWTPDNPFDRFADGRPKVPEALLEKVKGLSIEEIWSVLPGKGFPNQFDGNWNIMHPDKKLVGRVVTVQFMPMRGDMKKLLDAEAKEKGVERIAPHQRVIDSLQPGDVLVVDLFGKIEGGTLVGDNLATAVYSATGTGLVVDGAVRDMEGIYPIGMPVYTRGSHPSAINYQSVMLTGVNIPVRIGNVTVMPGDVAFGDRGGLYFIPPQYVKEIVDKADVTHVHDEWTKMKFMTGKYKSSDLYPTPKDPALRQEYQEYLKKKLGK
jgi:4-hydroxy-4-methyl-2-oxoglutarate aldolase